MRIPAQIEDWSDERGSGNPIMITLAKGWCFYDGPKFDPENDDSLHTKGFDSISEALYETAQKRLEKCICRRCRGVEK
jgi:hypothetical protein